MKSRRVFWVSRGLRRRGVASDEERRAVRSLADAETDRVRKGLTREVMATTTRWTARAGAVLFTVFTAVTASGQGVEPLTVETGNFAASELGYQALEHTSFNSPYLRWLTRCAAGDGGRIEFVTEPIVVDGVSCRMNKDGLQQQPFQVRLSTPYSLVALTYHEARRKYETPVFTPLDVVNATQVEVMVTPGAQMGTLDTIEAVVIKRGGQILRPLKSSVTPVALSNRMGAKVESAEGVFTFPFGAFAPDQPIILVLIGKRATVEWTMMPRDLWALK